MAEREGKTERGEKSDRVEGVRTSMTDRGRESGSKREKEEGDRQTQGKVSWIMVRERAGGTCEERRWNGITQRSRGAVIYCPWLIHSKCVEPRTSREEKGSRVMGGLKGGHADWWGLSACLLGGCQQSHHPLPSALTDSSGPLHTERERETSACLQKIKVTLQLLKCCFPLTFYFSCTPRKKHICCINDSASGTRNSQQ